VKRKNWTEKILTRVTTLRVLLTFWWNIWTWKVGYMDTHVATHGLRRYFNRWICCQLVN